MALKPVIVWEYGLFTLEVATSWLRLSLDSQLIARLNHANLNLFRTGLDTICEAISRGDNVGNPREADAFRAAGEVTIGAAQIAIITNINSGIEILVEHSRDGSGRVLTTRSQLAHAALIISGEL